MVRTAANRKSIVIAVVLAILFGIAAVAKARALEQLQLTLQRDLYLSGALAAPVSISLIAAEATVALLLLIRAKRSIGFLGSMVLSCLFMSFSFWRWRSGVTTPCTCFGLLLTMTPPESLALSASVFAGSIVGLRSLDLVASVRSN